MVQINIDTYAVLLFLSFIILISMTVFFVLRKKKKTTNLLHENTHLDNELLQMNFDNMIAPVSKPYRCEQIDTSDIDKGILNSIKEVAEAAQNAKGRNAYFEFVFDEKQRELLKQAEWMKRGNDLNQATLVGNKGIIANPKGKIIDGDVLQRANHIKKCLAVYQIASVVVAQEHLAAIRKSLHAIDLKIENVSWFQKSEQYSQIKGNLEFLHSEYNILHNSKSISSERKSEIRQKTNDIMREAMAQTIHIQEQIEKQVRRIKNQNEVDTFGSSKTFAAIKNEIEELQSICETYLLCLKVMQCTNRLHLTISEEESDFIKSDQWQQSIRERIRFLDKFILSRAEINNTIDVLMNAFWSKDDNLKLRKQSLSDILNVIEKTVNEESKKSTSELDNVYKLIESKNHEKYIFNLDSGVLKIFKAS